MFRPHRVPTCLLPRCAVRRPWHGRRRRMTAPIGAVGENLARIVRNASGPALPSSILTAVTAIFFHERRISVGADMGLEAMNRWLALMLDPMRITIALAGGGDDRRIDKSADLNPDRRGLDLAGDLFKQRSVPAYGRRWPCGNEQRPCAPESAPKLKIRKTVGTTPDHPELRQA
jgi:hypothetical protein